MAGIELRHNLLINKQTKTVFIPNVTSNVTTLGFTWLVFWYPVAYQTLTDL